MYEDLIEKKVSSEAIFDGVLLHVKRDTVELPNGKEATREWIKHPGASSVIPILPDGRITKLTTIATTVGFSNEKIHLYAAEGLTAGKQHTDEDEFINVVRVPLEEAVAMAQDGRIVDAKSVISILMLAQQNAAK